VTWPVVALGEVAETALGKMLDKGRAKGLPHVPYLRNVNVQWGHIDTDDLATMELADEDRERFAVREGDLLACEGGEIGRCAIWHGRADYLAFQKALHRIRPGGALDSRFLRYLLEHHSQTGTLARFATGSTIAHLPQQQLRRVPVPLPPVHQQRRIVEILEDHLSRVDAGDLYLDSAGRRLVALRRSTLEEQFGVSGHDVRLGELVTGIEAGRSFGRSTGPACSDGWGIIKVSALTWGEFRPKENKAVPAEQADPRYEIHEGDLLVSRANTGEYVGASVLVGPVRGRLLLSDKSLRLNVRPGVHPDWLWRALQSPSARGQMSALATGTKDSMRNISQKSLLQVRLPAHDSDHQRVAVNQFQAVEDALGRLALRLAEWHKAAFAMRRAMLAAAFSGRMTDRHTDREVMEELDDE